MMRPRHALFALLAFTNVGCEISPNEPSLYENVGRAFAECERARIKNLAEKHSLKGAFAWCGSNNFNHFTWNSEGWLLYFDLTHTANLLNAETKGMSTIPIDPPQGQPAWLTPTRLVVPVAPATADTKRRERIALFDPAQSSIAYKLVDGYTDMTDLTRGDDPNTLLFLATQKEEQRAYRMDMSTGTVELAFPWLTDTIDTLSYTPSAHALVVGRGDTVTMYDARDGSVRGSWSPANRGTLHPKGRFLALEHAGEEVSVFYQRTWDELSDKAREREQLKAQALEADLPDWYPKRVQLPTISFVDLEKTPDQRWAVRSFYGTRFQWYEAEDYYASFMLWGFEGRQFNRNVLLGDMQILLYRMTKGKITPELWPIDYDPNAPAAPAPTTPEAPAAQ